MYNYFPYYRNNQRSLLIPFIGGALLGGLGGYALSRPNPVYYYPTYYPYQYYQYPYSTYSYPQNGNYYPY